MHFHKKRGDISILEQSIHGDLVVHHLTVAIVLLHAKAGDHRHEQGLLGLRLFKKHLPLALQVPDIRLAQTDLPLVRRRSSE